MKRNYKLLLMLLLSNLFTWAQEGAQNTPTKSPDLAVDATKAISAQNLTYKGNEAIAKKNFVAAETAYRKAIGANPKDPKAAFNLGSSFYNQNAFQEALSPLKKAASAAEAPSEKHGIFHNLGNVFMKNKDYQNAVDAYKEALRNVPTDEETRYNLAIAKEMLKKDQQQKEEEQKDKDKQDQDKSDDSKDQENKDKQDQEGDQKKDKEGNPDKGEGDKKDDKGDPKDPSDKEKEEQKEGNGDQKKESPQKPEQPSGQPERKSQLSPQQVQNLLEAMQNAEKKSQDNLDAKKVKGSPVKTKKDW